VGEGKARQVLEAGLDVAGLVTVSKV
jgi:hypothetical protein